MDRSPRGRWSLPHEPHPGGRRRARDRLEPARTARRRGTCGRSGRVGRGRGRHLRAFRSRCALARRAAARPRWSLGDARSPSPRPRGTDRGDDCVRRSRHRRTGDECWRLRLSREAVRSRERVAGHRAGAGRPARCIPALLPGPAGPRRAPRGHVPADAGRVQADRARRPDRAPRARHRRHGQPARSSPPGRSTPTARGATGPSWPRAWPPSPRA